MHQVMSEKEYSYTQMVFINRMSFVEDAAWSRDYPLNCIGDMPWHSVIMSFYLHWITLMKFGVLGSSSYWRIYDPFKTDAIIWSTVDRGLYSEGIMTPLCGYAFRNAGPLWGNPMVTLIKGK